MSNNITSTDRLALVWALLYSSPIVKFMVVREVQAKALAVVEEQGQVIVAEAKAEDTLEVEEEIEDASEAALSLGTPEHSNGGRGLLILSKAHQVTSESSTDNSMCKGADVTSRELLIPYPYHISVDTMNIKALLTLEQQHELEKQLIGSFRYLKNRSRYRQVFYDDAYGVTLYYKPIEAFRSKDYTLSINRHGYSHNSPLLQLLLRIIPRKQLKVSSLDVAIDVKAKMDEVFLVFPDTKLKIEKDRNTVYFGCKDNDNRMACYDKQLQMREMRGKEIGICARLEYRKVFENMKLLNELSWLDVQHASKYDIISNIADFDLDFKKQYKQFIHDPGYIKKSLTQKQRGKLRNYALQHSVNVYDLYLLEAQQNSLQELIYRPYDITQVFKAS